MRVVIAGSGSPAGEATTSALRERGHEAIEIGPEECDLRDFAAVQALADRLGLIGVNSALSLMLPYVITIVALVFASVRLRAALKARTKKALQRASAAPADAPAAAA